MTEFVLNEIVNSIINSDGTVTITPSSGIGNATISVALGHANTWTGVQTFGNNISVGGFQFAISSPVSGQVLGFNGTNWMNATVAFRVPGSSTGYTLLVSGQTGSSDNTLTLPTTTTDTIAALGTVETWTALQTFGTNISILGQSFSGSSPTTNQVIQFNGTNWVAATVSSGVTSVSNSDGTLTISPTSGAVVASIALGHANTWTATQTFTNLELSLLNPAATFTYNFGSAAITANRTIGLPLLTSNDTMAVLGFAQTWGAVQTFGTNISILGEQFAGSSPTSNQVIQFNGTNWIAATISSAVTSVTNSDGTLTISPTSGAVVASIALGHTNTWTGVQTFGNNISFGGATLNVSSLATNNLLQYNGTNWINVAPTALGLVNSVFGRTGTVVATSGDYTPTQVGFSAYPIVNADVASSAAIANTKIVGLVNLSTNAFSTYPLTPVTDFIQNFAYYDYYIGQNSGGTVYSAYDKFGNVVTTNSTPDFGALMNALFALVSPGTYISTVTKGYNIVIGPGAFKYATATAYSNLPGTGGTPVINVKGQGRNKTLLTPTTTGLTCFNVNPGGATNIVEFRDFKICNNNVGITGTGFNLGANPGEVHFEGVECRDLTTASYTGTLNTGFNSWINCSILDGPMSLTCQQTEGFVHFDACEFFNSSAAPTLTLTSSVTAFFAEITNCFFYASGIVLSQSGGAHSMQATITGNQFVLQGGTSTMITLSNLSAAVTDNSCVISGNAFTNNNGNTGHSWSIGNNWTNVSVKGNSVSAGSGAITPVYGTGLATGNVIVTENSGYNPQGFAVSTPSVPSSAGSYTSTFVFPIEIYILTATVAGTASYTITDRLSNTSSAIPLVAGSKIRLDPGCIITPTYTTLTWEFYGI